MIGLAGAWRAAGAGLKVALADPEPGRGASWVAAGMLAGVAEAYFGETDLGRLLRVAAGRWPAFAAELTGFTGEQVGFLTSGTLAVALDAADRRAAEDLLAYQHSLGLPGESLDGPRCRELVPGLSPGIAGGVLFPEDHQVDNRRLVAALLRAVEMAGVVLHRHRVTRLVTGTSGKVTGVHLEDGTALGAGTVALCAGAESGRVPGVPPVAQLPVRPVKGHILRLAGPPGRPVLPVVVRGMVRGRPCYMVPRAEGSLVVGATAEEKGFDRTIQAGAVRTLLDDARELVPGIDELELVEATVGLRPGSPDNGPLIGWTAVPGLLAATGHYRHGVLLTPITADAIGALLTGQAVPDAVAPFGPERPLFVDQGSPTPMVAPAAPEARPEVTTRGVSGASEAPAMRGEPGGPAVPPGPAMPSGPPRATGEALEVLVNGEEVALTPGTTLAEVVARVWPSGQGVAVAVDREVVPKARWVSTVVARGARIEVVTAAAGG